MSRLVFGSSEADEVLAKDKEARKKIQAKQLRKYVIYVVGEYSQTVVVHAHDKQDAIDKFDNGKWEEESDIWPSSDATWTSIHEGDPV